MEDAHAFGFFVKIKNGLGGNDAVGAFALQAGFIPGIGAAIEMARAGHILHLLVEFFFAVGNDEDGALTGGSHIAGAAAARQTYFRGLITLRKVADHRGVEVAVHIHLRSADEAEVGISPLGHLESCVQALNIGSTGKGLGIADGKRQSDSQRRSDRPGLENRDQAGGMGEFGQKGCNHRQAGADKNNLIVFQYLGTRHNDDLLGGVVG